MLQESVTSPEVKSNSSPDVPDIHGTDFDALMYRQMLRSVLDCTRSIQRDPNYNPSEVVAHAVQS